MKCDVLILGASYGSLLGTKLAMAGHRVRLVCTRPTADLINREGTVVRFPIRGMGSTLEVSSRALGGVLSASAPEAVDPAQYDLIVLGMQEPHYGLRGVRQLMGRVARARKPCLAIMNMPPLPYLRRIAALATEPLESCYTDPRVWDGFEPALTTLASPDPQAFRPPGEAKNVLEVGLPTNFKAARFDVAAATALLQRLEADIEQSCLDGADGAIHVPVKLKVHDSLFVPLAKWPMLITGNYRCIRANDMISIREAVHGNLDRSREIYQWVVRLCAGLGALPEDLVPFDKYAKAAEALRKPSAAARALFGGAMHIERVDRLMARIARQFALRLDALADVVALIDERLAGNRAAELRAVGSQPIAYRPAIARA